MKASAFEKLFRKVVREEIDYALRREIKSLKEDLRDELKPTIVEQQVQPVQRTPIPKNVQSSLKERIMGNSPAQSFTPNGALNDLLNETAQGNTNLESSLAPQEEVMPVEVANVVNKDYRELMRAIDAKKNSRP
jgi:hypothetical protein|tara:strand:- start:35 stop:436 length:402 start_codon:yes stop_codon:yes gene_type:complete